MNSRIGVAIITADRPEFFTKCLASMPKIDYLMVVNDGKPYKKDLYTNNIDAVIQNTRNMGVAVAKNKALRHLIEQDCDHLFLIEDDIIIKRPDVFENYIKTATGSGLWHLNYGLHGNYNRNEDGSPKVKTSATYSSGVEVTFYENILGAFSYYLKSVIKNVGYMDERYRNAFEHVDHTYRIIKLGLHPPFWYFPDIANSQDYIEDQTENYEGSKIRNEKEWEKNFKEAMAWFQHKFGYIPQRVPQVKAEEFLRAIETIETNYARLE